MLHHFKLEEFRYLNQELAMEEGKILHKILRSFFKGISSLDLKLDPIPKTLPFASLEQELLKRIDLITNHLAQGGLSYSILNHLLGHSWPLFIKFIKPFYLKKGDTAVLAHRSFHKELNFGGEHSQIETPFFDFGTDRLPLRGSIDSLDVLKGAIF